MWHTLCFASVVTVVFIIAILWPPRTGEIGIILPTNGSDKPPYFTVIESGAVMVSQNLLILGLYIQHPWQIRLAYVFLC